MSLSMGTGERKEPLKREWRAIPFFVRLPRVQKAGRGRKKV